MRINTAAFGIWETTPGMEARLVELHASPERWSCREIASMLSKEFGVELTKNSIIGKAHRMRLPQRELGPIRAEEKQPRRRIRVDAPIPPPPPRPAYTGLITIYQLRDYVDCKWPIGENLPFLYCGKQQIEGRVYCLDHCSMAYHAPGKRWA
jgi:GcrA cell cycle regulator